MLVGLVLGFIMSFGFGIIFFTLVEKSLSLTYSKVVNFILGSLLSDSILFWACGFISYQLIKIPYFDLTFKGIAGTILIFMAYKKAFQRITEKTSHQNIAEKNNFLTGVFLNLMNPANLLTWLFISNIYINSEPNKTLIYFGFLISNVFFMSAIYFLVSKNKKAIPAWVLKNINYLNATIFTVAGIKILYSVVQNTF